MTEVIAAVLLFASIGVFLAHERDGAGRQSQSDIRCDAAQAGVYIN